MYIYFIRNTTTHNYKIGKTINLKYRIKQLQTGCDSKLEIYKYIETDDNNLEKYLHHYFKDKKIIGEWFQISNDNIDYIIDLINNTSKTDNLSIKDLRLLAKINNIKGNIKKEDIIQKLNNIKEQDINHNLNNVENRSPFCVIL